MHCPSTVNEQTQQYLIKKTRHGVCKVVEILLSNSTKGVLQASQIALRSLCRHKLRDVKRLHQVPQQVKQKQKSISLISGIGCRCIRTQFLLKSRVNGYARHVNG